MNEPLIGFERNDVVIRVRFLRYFVYSLVSVAWFVCSVEERSLNQVHAAAAVSVIALARATNFTIFLLHY